jgi:hypothetical protein
MSWANINNFKKNKELVERHLDDPFRAVGHAPCPPQGQSMRIQPGQNQAWPRRLAFAD